MKNIEELTRLGDEMIQAYDFGEGVTVVGTDTWNSDDLTDLMKVVYVEYDDDPADAPSHKVSFHAKFTPAGSPEEAYALEVDSGNEIGSPNMATSSVDRPRA